MRHVDFQSLQEGAAALRRPFHSRYLAMYSSVYGGIVTDPVLMLIPIDDHIVHRGDGVFETVKCLDGKLYNMAAHLERLQRSADAIACELPAALEDVIEAVRETVLAGGERDCLVRLYVSRGPGSFGVDANDCPRRELYVVATLPSADFMTVHPGGGSLKTVEDFGAVGAMGGVKSCNYLRNVLLRKVARESGVDFAVAVDADGLLTEGPTENVGAVTSDGRLVFPRTGDVLVGTTMGRVLALAESLVAAGHLSAAGRGDLPAADLPAVSEVLVTGTSLGVTAITRADGRSVGTGEPGPVYRRLRALLEHDMRGNESVLTPVF